MLCLTAGLGVAWGAPGPGTVVLTPAEQAWLKAHPVIVLAPDPDFKPIEYFDKAGVYQGAAADIIRLLERNLGITISIARVANWDEAMARFKRREVDLLGAMVRTPTREQFALFSDTLVKVNGGIFSRSGSDRALTLKDLAGKKVAVVSNYTAHDMLRSQYPEIQLEVVQDVSTGLAKASLGMVDAYVENMANATFYSQEAGITNLQMVGRTDFEYRWGIGIRKDWPELQGILNKGLASISEQERAQALQRWIYIEGQRWRPTRTFVIGSLAGLFGILLLLATYWNRALKRLVRSRTASLERELNERQRAEAALQGLTDRLEERVRDRTAELSEEVGERIKSEQAARASEQMFRELFQNVADPIYIADLSGRLLAANAQASLELGYTEAELLTLGIPDLDALYTDPERIAEHFAGLSETRTSTLETVHRRKDGSTLPVEVRVRLIQFRGQTAVLGVARNLSERKHAEAERLRLEQQLLHAQKLESLGVLAGGIAHDFNNFLTAIVGNADLALMRLDSGSPAADNLRRIEKAAARASDLARQMLAYSGKGQFQLQCIDLNHLLGDMLRMLEVSISKKARLRLDLQQPLPAVSADPTQIHQIVMNLVINASEALGEESGEIAVSTGRFEFGRPRPAAIRWEESLHEGPGVFLEVSDTGCGMDQGTLARIFDPFFSTKFTGRGLGMAAVLGIVRAHRGAIEVQSEPGKGSTFRILLPASDLAAEPPGEAALEDDWRGSGTVLLVEDEEDVRAIGAELLRELGFKVITAEDGLAALELFPKLPELAFVFLDMTMPNMDGAQCFRELRRLDPAVRVILSSGYDEQEVVRKFTGQGLAGFVHKPYTLAKLRETIKALA